MITEEIKKYLSSLSKEELLAMVIRLMEEKMIAAAKLCNELAKMGR